MALFPMNINSSGGSAISAVTLTGKARLPETNITKTSFTNSGSALCGEQYGHTRSTTATYFEITVDTPFTLVFNNFSGNTNYFTPYVYLDDTRISNSWTALNQTLSAGTLKIQFYNNGLSAGSINWNLSISA